jgi:hypothetical protein
VFVALMTPVVVQAVLGCGVLARRLLVVCGVGYLVALLVMGWVASAASLLGGGGWDAVSSSAPDLLTAALPLAAGDFVVDLSIALGVHWALRPAPAARGG